MGFNYDWIFLNDEPFSEEFKKHTKDLVSGEAKYGLIRKEEWGDGFPQGINATLAQEKIDAVSSLTHTSNTIKRRKLILGVRLDGEITDTLCWKCTL